MSNTFDIILLTSTPDYPKWNRGYGAHRLASHLRTHGYSVLVLDFATALTFEMWKDICQLAIGENTQMVGFSTTWWPYRKPFEENSKVSLNSTYADWGTDMFQKEYPNLSSFILDAVRGNTKPWIDVVKSINKKTKIVVGGAKIDWYRDFPADNFISGQGENQTIDLLTQPKRIWPTVINHDAKSNLRDWGWITSSTKYTKFDQIQSKEILNLETSRGCRFTCKFCSFQLIGNKDLASYLKTEETLYDELLQNYEQWGTTQYYILDDTFNDSNEKVELMHRVSKRLPFDFTFWAYIRLDVAANNLSQLPLLKEAGLRTCFIGVESFHPETAKLVGKGMSAERRKNALYEMQKAWGDTVGIRVGYIVGLPGEDSNSVREAINWLAQPNSPVNTSVDIIPLIINPPGVFENHPMSEFDRNHEKYGYKIPDLSKHLFWTKDDGTDIKTFEQAYWLAEELKPLVNGSNGINCEWGQESVITDPINQYFKPLLEMLKSS